MGKISQKRRQFEIKKKQKRKKKLKKLKEKYFQTKDQLEKANLIEKMKRLAPHLNWEEILNQAEKANN